jgi:hypothetical protein
MDPRTRPDDLEGADCAACRRPVPAAQIRLLAERDDLVFAELDCGACGSVGLSIIVLRDGAPPNGAVADGPPPIREEDVLAMRSFLEDYRGDLRSLLSGRGTGAA